MKGILLDPIGTISLNKKGGSHVAKKIARTTIIILAAMFALASVVAAGGPHGHKKHAKPAKIKNVQLGPRHYYLVADMDESKL